MEILTFANPAALAMTYPVPHPTSSVTFGGRCLSVLDHSSASASTRRKLSCGVVEQGRTERGEWENETHFSVGTIGGEERLPTERFPPMECNTKPRNTHLRGLVHLLVEGRVADARDGHDARVRRGMTEATRDPMKYV